MLKKLNEQTLKGLNVISPGFSVAKPGVLRIAIIIAEQRDRFGMNNSNEAVRLKVGFNINLL